MNASFFRFSFSLASKLGALLYMLPSVFAVCQISEQVFSYCQVFEYVFCCNHTFEYVF